MAQTKFGLKPEFDIGEDKMPYWIQKGLRRRWHYPREVAVSDRTRLVYRIGRAHSVACSKRAVIRREMLGWVVTGGRCIGAIAATTYDVRCNGNQAMIDVMDLECGEEYELAYTLASAWEDVGFDVCRYGPILYFNSAWLDRKHRGGDLLRRCVDAVVGEVFPEFAIAVVKAPLSDDKEGPRKLQAAMRYYGRLGARQFPGRVGREGWMWAPQPKLHWLREPMTNPIRRRPAAT